MSKRLQRAAIALHLALTVGLLPQPTVAATSYRVQAGDTLGEIAEAYGVSPAAIVAVNSLADPNLILAGTALTIPTGAGSPGGAVTYRVLTGDTLSEIAELYGTSVPALLATNPALTDPDRIVAGQVLTVASAERGPSEAALPYGRTTEAILRGAADRYGLDPALVQAIAWQESGWQQDAVSPARALGLMQILPETAAWLASDIVGRPLDVAGSATDNAEAGAALLAWLLDQTADEALALAFYVQGQGSVARNGIYPETRQYIAAVQAIRRHIALNGEPPR